MQIKVFSILFCMAAVSAGVLPDASEILDSHPIYNFEYSVVDSVTGDVKSQTESREGDNVQGQYTVNDADGYKRIVEYTSDALSGFKAVVRRERLNENMPTKLIQLKQKQDKQQQQQQQEVVFKPAVVISQKPKYISTKPATTTLVHHQPSVYHGTPHTLHLIHTPPSATILKSSPALITTTHHHTPAIVHHSPTVVHHAPAAVVHHAPALVKTSISAPHHVSYVHYHH